MIVVTDPDKRRRMRELYEQPWDAYMVETGGRAALDAGEASGLPAGRLRMLRGADEFARTFDQVPVHLVICVELTALAIVDSSLDRPSIVGGASIYPFVQNVLLGLRAEGLGRRVHDAADAGRGGGARAARDSRRRRDGGPHLGRPSRRPVAQAADAQAGERVRVRRPLRRGLVARLSGARRRSRRVRPRACGRSVARACGPSRR